MSKLPEISISEWIEAEERMRQKPYAVRPKGSITTREYAESTGRSLPQAGKVLLALFHQGEADRQLCRRPTGGREFVYLLKKK